MITRTTTQLLEALTDQRDTPLWIEFDARYRPVLLAFARSRGLEGDHATEVAQVTLAQFADDFSKGKYDRTKGRLSSYILGIAHHRVIDALRARDTARHARGESAIGDQASAHTEPGDAAERDWDEARRTVILDRAMTALRGEGRMARATLDAFELSALRGVPAEETARQCAMSVNQVYVSRSRVLQRLREIVHSLEREYDDA